MQSIAHLSVLQLLTIGVLAAVSLFVMCRRKRKVRRRKQQVDTAEEKATTAVPAAVQKPPMLVPPQAPLNVTKEPAKGTAVPPTERPKSVKKVPPSDTQKPPSKGTAIPMKLPPRSTDEKLPSDTKIPASTSDVTVMHFGGSTARPPSEEEPARSGSGDKDPFIDSNPENEPPVDDEPTGVEPSQEEPGGTEPGEDEPQETPTQPMPVVVKEPSKEKEPTSAKEKEPTSAKEKEPKSAIQAEPKKSFVVGPLTADTNRLYFPSAGGIQKLKIKNTSEKTIALLMECSVPDKFAIKPSSTFVEPNDETELTIKRSAGGDTSGIIHILYREAEFDEEDPRSLFVRNPIKVKDKTNCMPITTAIQA